MATPHRNDTDKPEMQAPEVPTGPPESRWKKAFAEVGGVLLWCFVALGAVAYATGRWIISTFGYITPDQALMNLQGAGADGGGGAELVRSGVLNALVLPLTLTVVGWLTTRILRRALRTSGRRAGARATYLIPLLALAAVPLLGAWSLGSAVQLRQYLESADPSLDLADYYAEPALIEDRPSPPTNLVLIYLESIEDAFSDDEVFGTNMLSSLENATDNWQGVEALNEYPGGGWTMSGIISTQCGVPLRMPAFFGVDGTDTTDQAGPLNNIDTDWYLPNAVCLGDVLAEHGYEQVFMGGAYTQFASKGQFLKEHGYTRVRGREHWEQQGETELTASWGLSDRRLFQLAKEELVQLHDTGEPFALTLLTLDTHEPAAIYDYCDAQSETPLADATRCSIDVVADFVEFMKNQGYLQDTAVIIMGDHLKFTPPKSTYGTELDEYPDRTIFNRIWVPNQQEVRADRVDQLDMFPTILEALGLKLEDGRAGLGVSAYNPNYVFGSLRELSPEDRERMVRSRSTDFYERLWGNSPERS